MTNNLKSQLSFGSKFGQFIKWLGLFFCLAYLGQFFLGILHKGQMKEDVAWEILGYTVFQKQYDGFPQMRVIGASASPNLCEFWNFEEIWGYCVSVTLHVRDFQPQHQSIVEHEVIRLAEQLSKPCLLLPKLDQENKAALADELKCGGLRSSFKLRIWVDSVTVADEKGMPEKPYRWKVQDRKTVGIYHFKGEL